MKIDTFHVGIVQTNCYLVYDEDSLDAFVIDPGDDAARILNTVKAKKLNLRYIILTHGHFDHLLAVAELIRKTGAKLIASRYARLDDEAACGFLSFGLSGFSPLAADIKVSDGERIAVSDTELLFIETPGHTPCSMCVLMGDMLFSGDTLFAGSCGRCDLVGGNYAAILNSLLRISKMDRNIKVLPGHGEATTIEREIKTNPYMREAIQ